MPAFPGGLRPSLRRADFRRATRRGRRVVTHYFLVFALDRRDGRGARLGITVTRRVGPSVRRNRIKRLVREWFRKRVEEIGSCDLVVIAKRGIPERLSLDLVGRDLDQAIEARSPGSSSD